jgi:hypothetical protein
MARKRKTVRSRTTTQSPPHYLEAVAKGLIAWVGTLTIVGGFWMVAHFLFQ